MTAKVVLPAGKNDRITENGADPAHNKFVRIVERQNDETILTIVSGTYNFEITY